MNKEKGVRDLKTGFGNFLGALFMPFCAFSHAFSAWDLIPSARDSQWVFLGRTVARPTNFRDPNPPLPTPVAVFLYVYGKNTSKPPKGMRICIFVMI